MPSTNGRRRSVEVQVLGLENTMPVLERAIKAYNDSAKASLSEMHNVIYEAVKAAVERLKGSFQDKYSAFASFARTRGMELSPGADEMLSYVENGDYINGLSVVPTEMGADIVAEPKFALLSAILEYGNSEIAPMPHNKDMKIVISELAAAHLGRIVTDKAASAMHAKAPAWFSEFYDDKLEEHRRLRNKR